jgi:hypothetical protein
VIDGDHAGAIVYNNYSLQPQALGRIKALMIAVGAPLDKISGAALLDGTFTAEVVHTEGAATVGADGSMKPARTFANVVNERPLDGVEEAAPPPKPPVTRGAATKNGATARRA